MATNISFSTYGFMNGILILSEENWRTFFKPFITDSVQSGLATIAGANMTVYVSAGECRCGAVMGILDEMIALDIADGDSTYNRIDSVIVQYTYGEPSTLAVAIVQGIPSANPVPPTLTKVYDTLWQMEIAQILVPSGATSSSELTITDKRVIYESIESIIDDNTESEERTWSSQKTHEEIVSLSSEIYDSLNTKADAITRTASGNIVTITDGSDNLPVKELVVGIEPVQDLHGYDNPWPAGGGKNLCDPANVETITIAGQTRYGYTFDEGTYYICKSSGDIYFRIYQNDISEGTTTNVPTTPATRTIQEGYHITIYAQTLDLAKSKICVSTQAITQYEPYSNICPISGHSSAVVTRTGKNLLNPTNVIDGYPSGTGISTSTGKSIYFPVVGGQTYTISKSGGTRFKVQYSVIDTVPAVGNNMVVDDTLFNNNSAMTATVTVPDNAKWIVAQIVYSGDDNKDAIVASCHVELGSTASAFEPYQGTSVTIDLDGTRYGGVLDVLTGEMTVDRAMVDLGTLTWSKNANGQFFTDTPIFAKTDPNGEHLVCSMYKGENAYDGAADKCICVRAGTASRIWVRDNDYTTASDFKTAVNGQTLVYELATPLTVQLSPSTMQTLLGQNAIWADTGNIVNLTYRTDTKTYIEQKVADTNRKTCEMITIVTDKMVAPDNLTVGDLVIVNDGLYKVINSNIASGEAMVVGTNVMKITLAEYIQSLI